jgi:soluble lytic murein transglycosylase-like protein
MPIGKKLPDDIVRAIFDAAVDTGVPIELLHAVAKTESGYNPRAVSPVGAQGLFQLMPSTQVAYSVTDPFNPAQSATAGAKILAKLYRSWGSWEKALASYNWGIGRVQQHPDSSQWPVETQNYVLRVFYSWGRPPPFSVERR